ncbi:hypothetical protein [Natranaerobius trueperi]|nr:hypothetical protein [Natranaerobius trueperi]
MTCHLVIYGHKRPLEETNYKAVTDELTGSYYKSFIMERFTVEIVAS